MSAEALATLLAQPALPAPPGVTPNFDNPPKSNTIAWVVTTLCLVIATICLSLRLFARVWLEKKMRAEEGESTISFGSFGYKTRRLTASSFFSFDDLRIRMESLSMFILHAQ